MLTEKEIHTNMLSTVQKNSAKIIKLKKPAQKAVEKPDEKKKADHKPTPPLDRFNTGYMKGRDNDPL